MSNPQTSSATLSSTTNKTDWRAVVDDWQSSGLSVSQFCRQHQWPEHQVHYYRRKYSMSQKVESSIASTSGFAQVSIQKSSADVITIRLPNGFELSGFSSHNSQIIANMIKALS